MTIILDQKVKGQGHDSRKIWEWVAVTQCSSGDVFTYKKPQKREICHGLNNANGLCTLNQILYQQIIFIKYCICRVFI